jgi:hypothetical protein
MLPLSAVFPADDKGFQYLLPIAPPIAVLAGRTLSRFLVGDIFVLNRRITGTWIKVLATGFIALSLFVSSIQLIRPATSGTFIAGTGGVPGGREAGEWIKENIPTGSTLMTIGPSMANTCTMDTWPTAFVSPNPLRRNPSYLPT